MCGIAGIIAADGHCVSTAQLEAMSQQLKHRGPDDHGYLLLDEAGANLTRDFNAPASGRLGLVHRRLSIIDPTESGWQPMASPDGRVVIVFNGEIYNFLELRREIAALGYRFRSRSDTEVLLAGYIQWGSKVLTRLVGMFALAILDLRHNTILLARDFFGIKPLYYTVLEAGFAFASEMKALLALRQVSRRIDPQAMYRYLRSGVTDAGEATMFAAIRQVPAAHAIELTVGGIFRPEPRPFWSLPRRRERKITFEEAAENLRALFLESIELHLRSDVPVGAALSGGIDSSSIVMAMRRLGGPRAEIHAFTYAADDPAIAEERYADLIGRTGGIVLHKIELSPEELIADFDPLILAQDQPFGSPSIYAQYRVFKLAAQHRIKVMLNGQGADEMLAGYRPYLAARMVSLLRGGELVGLLQLLREAALLSEGNTGRGLLRLAAGLAPQGLLDFAIRLRARTARVDAWLDSEWFARQSVLPTSAAPTLGRRTLSEALELTFSQTSLPALLRYEDRNSMAHSIESRVPFLTPRLVEFLFQVPESWLISRDGISKFLLRAAMRGLVPDAVLDRKDKIGFQTPELPWLRALFPWVEKLLRGAGQDIPGLNVPAMQSELTAILEGRLPFDWRIWRWINLIRWTELMGVEYG